MIRSLCLLPLSPCFFLSHLQSQGVAGSEPRTWDARRLCSTTESEPSTEERSSSQSQRLLAPKTPQPCKIEPILPSWSWSFSLLCQFTACLPSPPGSLCDCHPRDLNSWLYNCAQQSSCKLLPYNILFNTHKTSPAHHASALEAHYPYLGSF